MKVITLTIFIGTAVLGLFLLWIGLWAVLSLDAMFHETRKVKPNDFDLNKPGNRITYIGHSTTLIQLDGTNIITDPIFSEKILGISKRYVEPGIPLEHLPKIDAIIISHEHFDHFDKPSLKKFDKNISLIVPKGLVNKVRKLGFNDIRELSWWEDTEIKGLKITATPIKHFLSHSSSYIIEGTKTVYFVGDTGPNGYFKEIGKKFDIDFALLPIGAYRPHLGFIPGFSQGMKKTHLTPEDIPLAQKTLKAKIIIPIHWGVFKITAEPIEEPQEKIQEIINQSNLSAKILMLKPGEASNF